MAAAKSSFAVRAFAEDSIFLFRLGLLLKFSSSGISHWKSGLSVGLLAVVVVVTCASVQQVWYLASPHTTVVVVVVKVPLRE